MSRRDMSERDENAALEAYRAAACAEADAHLDDRMLNGAADKDAFFALVERARGHFAELIGAESDEIAFATYGTPNMHPRTTAAVTNQNHLPRRRRAKSAMAASAIVAVPT